jgi:predicted molibdopterin-dependent oxidoreductase YjgC
MPTENSIVINGNKFLFEPGQTILEIAHRNSIDIPTLCHLKRATPTGACRMCVVEVEGARSLVASCAAPAAPNMIVRTETAKVIEARRMVLQLLLSSGNHNCAVCGSAGDNWTEFQLKVQQAEDATELCPVWGDCRLQDLAFRYQVTGEQFETTETPYPMETANPFIIRDFSRCIQCGRCVQACGAGKSGHPFRLSRSGHQNYCRRRSALHQFGLCLLRRMRTGMSGGRPGRKGCALRGPSMGNAQGADHLQLLRCGLSAGSACQGQSSGKNKRRA